MEVVFNGDIVDFTAKTAALINFRVRIRILFSKNGDMS